MSSYKLNLYIADVKRPLYQEWGKCRFSQQINSKTAVFILQNGSVSP